MTNKIKLSNFHYKRVHFVGIGGSGMIALAQYLRAYGKCKISGSDITQKPALKDLELQGIKIYNKHSKSNIEGCHLVVYSTAINSKNEELIEAKAKKIICMHRSEFLNLILSPYERKITISGTHGKTTTTGMLVHILDIAGINPSFMIGGELLPYNVNGRFAESTTFVAESDESDGSFLNIDSSQCIINNIEEEHLNYYKTKENLLNSFKKVLNNVTHNNGNVIVNLDDENIRAILENTNKKNIFTFSLSDCKANLFTKNIVYNQDSTFFELYQYNKQIGEITLNTLGTHNIYNALACISLCLGIGISMNSIKKGLLNFKGVKRRLQLIYKNKEIKVFDDYAHHPTEIKTTLNGLKKAYKNNITCIFQPHRYSRTKELLNNFFNCFENVETLILTPIYAANEEETEENKKLIFKLIEGIKSSKNSPKEIHLLNTNDEIIEFSSNQAKKNNIIITMGAGNINLISKQLKNVFNNGGVQNKKTLQLSNK